jgi:hypothetical protein
MANICFISNFSFSIIGAVERAIEKNKHNPTWLESKYFSRDISDEERAETINKADLIIFDITNADENIFIIIGLLAARKKPMIFIADNILSIPLSLKKIPVLIYDIEMSEEFIQRLSSAIVRVFENPDNYTYYELEKQVGKLKRVFISYSHKDEKYMDRIRIHLKPLEVEGLIDVWVDKKIKTGDKWKNVMEKALQDANVAVLLISADYLASDFIVNNELPQLLKNAETNGTLIFSVIIKPCRFDRDSKLNIFQAINDPTNPVVSLPEHEQEKIYDLISYEIEKRLENFKKPESA